MQLQAILFDLDGVLVDTIELHFQTWCQLATDEGMSLTRHEFDTHLCGRARQDGIAYLTRERNVSQSQLRELAERKNRYFLQRMPEMELIPGGNILLQEIREAGIKMAVASASKNCRTLLRHLDILHLIDGIADGNSVYKSKPAADLFIFAAGTVNTPLSACLALDDKPANIAALQEMGIATLGIGSHERFFGTPTLPTLAHHRLHDLTCLVS